ncbi:cytochrome P450 [Mycena galopus ATCC 62051]|nr:cytochrome P450 [Mycena galopus ATCC 62051]
MSFYLYAVGGGTFLAALYSYFSQGTRSKLPLPPGPTKWPVVGNLFDMPATFEWITFMEWSKKYNSDILHLNVAGQSIIVLSSAEAANDLLEKKASIYSDRARLPMVNELMGWDFALAFMKYGDHWRAHRRLFHEVFNSVAAQSFRPKEREVTNELLNDFLEKPDHDLLGHLRHMAAKIVMSIAYGIDVLPANDPYVEWSDAAVEGLVTAIVPGRFLVDSFPFLKYVPAWFPGAGFQRKAQNWRRLARGMLEKPFAEATQKIASGKAPHSFTLDGLRMVEGAENKDYMEQVVQATAGTMYTAGTGTTVSALGTFILSMLANPEAQKKAQAEIDSVIGQDRLPDFDDEASLPYVAAVMKESLRWRNVTPIAIPHFLPVEDEYRGYRLPAGSIVMPNTWAILHDEAMYPDPYSFKPERYLLDGKLNPAVTDPDIVFGFGRRICPGRHMATSSVWLSIARILATFDITKAVGEDGQIIEPTYEYFAGLVVQPLPFKCSIKPRSEKAAALIKASLQK